MDPSGLIQNKCMDGWFHADLLPNKLLIKT